MPYTPPTPKIEKEHSAYSEIVDATSGSAVIEFKFGNRRVNLMVDSLPMGFEIGEVGNGVTRVVSVTDRRKQDIIFPGMVLTKVEFAK